jgi:hypothetical protein
VLNESFKADFPHGPGARRGEGTLASPLAVNDDFGSPPTYWLYYGAGQSPQNPMTAELGCGGCPAFFRPAVGVTQTKEAMMTTTRPTPEHDLTAEVRDALNEAVRRGFLTLKADGTYSLTEAGGSWPSFASKKMVQNEQLL